MSVHRMASPLAFSDIRTAMLLALAVVLAGCETTQPSENEFLTTHDDDIKVRPEARALQLPLPNGNSLEILASPDEDGELHVHGLVEYRKAKNRGIASVPGLSTASIPEIYYALAEPNAEIPELLRLDRYPDPTRPQGWARDIILTGGPEHTVTCSGTWGAFRQEVINQGYPLVSLYAATGPATEPSHWDSHLVDVMTATTEHTLRGGVDDAIALYVSVLRCSGETPDFSSWGSPRFVVGRRPAGEEFFDTELEDFLPETGDQATYITPESALGTESDYRVSLRHYEGGTEFHIGAAWLKPSGTFGPIQ